MSSVPAKWMIALAVAMFTAPAWACFPAPGAKPKHEVTTVALPQQVHGIGVRFESEGFVIQVAADDLLSEFSKSEMSVASPSDLTRALRSKMALGQDFDSHDVLSALISDVGTTDSRPESWITIQANVKLRYAFANLLAAGKASVTEAASGQVLAQLELDRFREICHAGRLYTGPGKQTILHIVDAIS